MAFWNFHKTVDFADRKNHLKFFFLRTKFECTPRLGKKVTRLEFISCNHAGFQSENYLNLSFTELCKVKKERSVLFFLFLLDYICGHDKVGVAALYYNIDIYNYNYIYGYGMVGAAALCYK